MRFEEVVMGCYFVFVEAVVLFVGGCVLCFPFVVSCCLLLSHGISFCHGVSYCVLLSQNNALFLLSYKDIVIVFVDLCRRCCLLRGTLKS